MKSKLLLARIAWFTALLLTVLGMCSIMFLACTTSGCALLRGACASALSTITAAQSYEADARAAVAEARMVVDVLPDPPRGEILAGLAECDLALAAVDAVLVAASSACTSLDPITTYAALIDAWTRLEPKMRGGLQAKFNGAVQGIRVPLIVLKARGQ